MPFHPQPDYGGREVPVQNLDPSRLSMEHEWDLSPQTEISFRYVVEENPEPRADAQRFKLLANVSVQAAQTAFSKMCRSSTLFKIPGSIPCDRTFARDAEESYYVDAMNVYLSKPPGPLRVGDLPILKSPLRSRYFCSFGMRPIHYTELYERRRTGRWISNSSEISYFSDTELSCWFPKVEEWLREIEQPTALPVPTPPSLHFYNMELRDAQVNALLTETERIRRLRFCAEKEYYILIIAMWWNDLFYGGKAFVLTERTITVLNEHCGEILDIAGKPAQAIIERMRMFADMPKHFHNWLCFNDRSLENAPFIFAVRHSGAPDHTIRSGRRLWCRRHHRSVTTTRYPGNTFRRISLLEQRVTVPDLDDVPGLIGLVEEQRWTEYNSMRIGDLLQRLIGIYRSASTAQRECDHRIREEQLRHDSTLFKMREADDKVRALRRELYDTRQDLEKANRVINNLEISLQRARLEVGHLKRDNTEKQQRIIATQQRVRELYYQPPTLSRSQVLRSTNEAHNICASATPRTAGGLMPGDVTRSVREGITSPDGEAT